MTATQWQYLESRPSSWRQQLHFKGRRLRPFTVWRTMLIEKMSPSEAADDWDLPVAAVQEAIAYCEANQELLQQEVEEERRYLEERGISLKFLDDWDALVEEEEGKGDRGEQQLSQTATLGGVYPTLETEDPDPMTFRRRSKLS